jgi:hypothetical protein
MQSFVDMTQPGSAFSNISSYSQTPQKKSSTIVTYQQVPEELLSQYLPINKSMFYLIFK